MSEKKHKHKWQFVSVQYEYPEGYSGTAAAVQYAFLLCQCTAVSYGGWNGGSFESFWDLEKAIRYAKKQKDLFVDIENEITGECIRVRNNPDNIQPPVIQAHL